MKYEVKEFTIKCKMNERWIPHFLGMLKSMERLGGLGGSRWVRFYSDGDGDYRPKFKWNLTFWEKIKILFGSADLLPKETSPRKIEYVGKTKSDGYDFDAG